MNRIAVVVLYAALLMACSTMQYTPNSQTGTDGVRVLYDYPKAKYRNLGVIDFD